MMNFKENISTFPIYDDGKFDLYKIVQTDEIYPKEYLEKALDKPMWFQELSLSDSLKFNLEQREKKIVKKIRIPLTKQITSFNVLEIENQFYKVFNIYHFVDTKDGFLKSDVTLEEYPNPKIKEE